MTAGPRGRWFDRAFAGDREVELFPNLITRLAGTPARLEDLVLGLPEETRTHRPGGKWSIQEHAGHLLDLEPLWRARLDDFDAGAETLTPADLENRKTHEARHNDSPPARVLATFREERLTLIRRLDALPAEAFASTALHPRLRQPMRLIDLLDFVAEHDDHHLTTIRAALST